VLVEGAEVGWNALDQSAWHYTEKTINQKIRSVGVWKFFGIKLGFILSFNIIL
jgi:hypothetical protein